MLLQGFGKEMSSLILDLSHSNGHVQIRKQGKATAMAKERERSCLRFRRMIIGRRIGMLVAVLISVLSLLMLMNATRRVSSPSKLVTDDEPPSETVFNGQLQNLSRKDIQVPPPSTPPPFQRPQLSGSTSAPLRRVKNHRNMLWPLHSSYNPLPLGHPCQGFTLPPPPADKKRTGPRPCPVCYLPVEKAIEQMPVFNDLASSAIKQLSYVVGSPTFPLTKRLIGTEFGGHPTMEDRRKSYQIQEHMNIFCGFVQAGKPGVGSGFDIEEADQAEMDRCTGIVVASAIFGNYDQLQQPRNISEESRKSVCFFMFVDEETQRYLDRTAVKGGVWRVVVVRNLPYSDARRNGKIPKLLLHRLFPNARFSLWIDGKLELIVDPYQVMERFLWRHNFTFAISRHYRRFDVFEEAEANKAARKYDNASINGQMDFYRSEGLVPYNRMKSPFPSDVPEGCVIIREHTPITNLFTCLWFNEVDHFTSRDQLSFAIVRDKLMERVPFRLSMFLDCERRNFVVQGYHRDLLEQRKAVVNTSIEFYSQSSKPHSDLVDIPPPNMSLTGLSHARGIPKSHARHRRGAARRRKMGSRVQDKGAQKR